MPIVTYAGLYLGRLADMDPTEGTGSANVAENAHIVLGGRTFGATGSPLYAQSTRITLNDTNNDGQVPFNQNTGSTETISYRLGDQNYSFQPDTIAVVQNCTIIQRLPDGTTRSITGAGLRVMQDVSGNAFIMPPLAATGTEAQVLQYPIISVTLPTARSNYDSDYSGVSTTRENLIAFRDGYVDGTDGNDSIVAGWGC